MRILIFIYSIYNRAVPIIIDHAYIYNSSIYVYYTRIVLFARVINSMDSNTSGYLLNHATLPSVYYQGKDDDGIIDLGLSLRVLQPESYHPSGHGIPLCLVRDFFRPLFFFFFSFFLASFFQ